MALAAQLSLGVFGFLTSLLGLYTVVAVVNRCSGKSDTSLVLCSTPNSGAPANSSSTPSGSNGSNKPNPGTIVLADLTHRLDTAVDAALETWELPELSRLFSFTFDWNSIDMEQLATSIIAALPRFIYTRATGSTFTFNETPQATLLAQAEAVTHRPLGFASSPSLPGTIASPWWTDFAHLIYWFYFVATFTTVAFLWYLYDLKVRRVETAHPIRETRGFSRAQTGDLVTAVLPLTWSATMVMHASTHSINFDENTAGTVFSLTVIAYQWGWNYYFPRDIIAKFETAPRVVGRGRVVSFEATPIETLESTHLDSWALRATIGSRHGSRSGRLNTSPALPLVLPTDVAVGTFATLGSASASQGWRKTLATFLNDSGTAPYTPALTGGSTEVSLLASLGFDTSTLFRAKPSVYIAGSRLTLVHNHFATLALFSNCKELSWVTRNFFAKTGADAQTRATRNALAPVASAALPLVENLAGAAKLPLIDITGTPVDLSFGRGPSVPSHQHLIWTGPDALTGAGSTTLMSTEEHGWTSPVTARESALRSALALKTVMASGLSPFVATTAQTALLLPFDTNARVLLQHSTAAMAGLPFSWAAASVALEAEVDSASLDLWAHALAPEVSGKTLALPASLIANQRTSLGLRHLQSYSSGLKSAPAFILEALTSPTGSERLFGARSKSPLATYTCRLDESVPSLLTSTRPAVSLTAIKRGRVAKVTYSPSFLVHPFPMIAPGRGRVAKVSVAKVTYSPSFIVRPLTMGSAPAPKGRVALSPSSLGFGLDEARLIRTGTSRFADTALIANKLESLAGPSLALPATPVSLLGLGWSTTASLSSYPSYKLARGGLFRRPFTGVSQTLKSLEGLKEGLQPLLLGKNNIHLGVPKLALVQPSMPRFTAAAPSLDTQVGAWASVWAVLTPAPTEDLDPTFINAVWTPETNTTRRSDHNSRYLVSWSPLLSPLTARGAFNPSLSGPSVRAGHSTAALRTSVLALNELGLKNSFGVRGMRHRLLSSLIFSTDTAAHLADVAPTTALSFKSTPLSWVALWAAFPSATTNPFINSATQTRADNLSGRSASLMTRRGLLARGGTYVPLSVTLAGGDRLNPLTDALAKLEFARTPFEDAQVGSKQGYVPLNSAISVSRRLRVTKGVTLPSDTPMHVICGSKDVIHSWAIPGLNVKIDCVPGYNSHRRLLLRWRGAYWGQCMEVCGRYHHWMPIMINVVHPALFIDWCLTFLRGLDTQSQNGAVGLPAEELTRLLRVLSS